MRRRFRHILCALSLLLGVATVAVWFYVAFYTSRQFTWQDQREYSLNLGMYAYELDILHCKQQAGVATGDMMRSLPESEVAVPMRGVEHYRTRRRGHGFYIERVRSWPAVNPARPLPPPIPLDSGGTLRTQLDVEGLSVGVPYWFVIVLCLVQPSWLAAVHLRARKRLWRARHKLCVRCGYDLRATPGRCPECGTIPMTVDSPPHRQCV